MKRMYSFLLSMTIAILLSGSSWATDYYVDATRPDNSGDGLSLASAKKTIQAAVTTASAGDVVIVAAGIYNENVALNKSITLRSVVGSASTTITGSTGTLGTLLVQADNVTIGGFGQGFTINGYDSSSPGLEYAAVYIQGVRSNITIRGNNIVANGEAGLLTEFGQAMNNLVVNANTFSGKTFTGAVAGECGFGTQFTAPNVPRQLVNIPTGNGITFTSNNITGTAGSSSIVSGCETFGQGNTLVTIDAQNNVTIRGNTFAGTTTRFGSSLRARALAGTGSNINIACNTFDNTGLGLACTHIVLAANSLAGLGSPNSLAGIASQNTFNEGAYFTGAHQIYRDAAQVAAQPGPPVSIAVNTTILANVTNTNTGEKFCTIQAAIDDANTVNGHTIAVAAGTYNEDVVVNKQLTINGAGIDISTVKGPKGGGGATFQIAASNVVIAGFTITRDGNNVADWDNANGVLNIVGIAIQGQSITNAEIKNNKLIGNRNGIDINNSNGHNIHNNLITDNRTGLIFRNQTDNITLIQNEITNNWTMGILFLDASSGSNSPIQTAANSNFNNNKITGNWYAGVVDRQSGGSLPTPGSNLKNFGCNWYGSTSPVITTANSAELGYSAIIPVAYGGSAVNPGGAPDIAGAASANISYILFLVNGTDNDAGTIGFQPVPNSCSGCVGGVSVQNTNTGEYFCTIQAAIDDANTVNGHTIAVAAGTYNENVNITKSLTITGAGKGSNPALNTVLSASTACSGVGITVAAANVTVSNMYLTGYQDGVLLNGVTNPKLNNLSIVDYCRYGVNLGGSNQNVEIKQSTIQRTTILASTVGVRAGTANAVNGMLIDECIINGNMQGMAVFQATTPSAFDNITIQNSTISNNTQKGLYFEKLSNALLSNLTMNNNGTDAAYGFNNGIDINLKYGSYTNITIQNSDITNSGATGTASDPEAPAAITIKARDDSPSYNTIPASLSNVTLQNNKITGPTNGIRFGEFGKTNATPTNITIQNNDLSYAFSGKAVISRINGNIDMKCNWHGTTNAATIPSTFTTAGSGLINLITYLANGTDNAPAVGFQPAPGSCTGCPNFVPTITVTETSGTTNNDGTICSGASITLTSSVGVSYVWNTGPMTQGITVSPTTTTPYSVTVTDANGCVAVASTTVTVNTVTAGSLSSNVASICQGGSVDISHTGNTGTGAFVVFQNGTVLASFATSEQVEAFFSTATPGQYCVYSFAYLETPSCGNFAGFTLAQVINNCFGQKCYDVSDPLCITVTANNTVGSASSSPTLCINTVLTSITHSTTGATGIGTATGLPMGVTAAWAANTITISGTPTQSGIFNYSIPLTGGCGSVNATGMLTVTANNTVGSASSSPTLCINTVLTSITHSTTGATGIGTATGLPMGVTAAWAANTITISGTPTQSGIFNYSIPLTGGCGSVNATGMLTVTANNTVGSASSSPTLCINTVLASITHSTTGATGIGTATGLPMGVTAAWAANTITISGTPTQSGIFNYSIPLTGGCGSVNATGILTVTANNTVGSASSSPTLCINTVLASITHSTTGATGIGTATGLPMGVTAAWAANTITISGTPTQSGIFNYSIPLTGGCGSVNATGMLTVTANNTVGSASSSPTLCINTVLTSITHSTTGATGIGTATGLPMGVTAAWAANTITISGTPTQSGIFNYSIPLTGGCGSVNATGTLTVNPLPTASISGTTAVCQNAPFPSVTFTGSGGTAPYTFTYQINGGSEQTITTSSGNSVSVSQSTAMADVFLYTLVSVKDASSTQCTQPITGQTATITVNAPPTLGSTPASLCTGQSFTLSPIVGGTWISSNPSLATVNLPTAGVVQGLAPGSVYFTFTETLTGCSSKTADVLIKQTPSSALTASKYDVCPNTEVTLNPNCSIPTSTLQWNPGAPTVTPAAATLPYVYRARCVADGCVGNETSVEVRTHRILVDMKDLDVGALPLPIVRPVIDNMKPTNQVNAPVFPRRWTFIANGCDASESAEFKLSGPVLFNAIDNTSTYAMFANEGNTFYSIDHPNYGNGGSFPDGEYSLTVNLRSKDGVGGPYPKNRVPVGALLATRTLKFTVGNPVGLRQGVESIGSELSEANWVMVVQNPVSEEVMVKLSGKVGEEIGLSLVNLQGQSIQQRSVKLSTVDQAEVLNIRNAPSGLYILKAIKGDKVKTIKVVKVD